jgi:hypothetical protein
LTEEFHDNESLLSRLRVLVGERSPMKFIGIEGFMGSGKSYLAKHLATIMPAWCMLGVDDCSLDLLYPEQASSAPRTEPYIECLDLDVLAVKLSDALARCPVVVIEGICLGDVLERIGESVDLMIYLKVIGHNGIWHDGMHLDNYESGGSDSFGKLHRDQLEYHSRMKPHEKADLLLVRVEDPQWPEGTYVAKR